MRTPWEQFDGGLNTQEVPQYVGDNQSPDMQNVQPFGKGGYFPRFGITALGNLTTGAGVGRSLYNFLRPNLELLLRSQLQKLQYLDDLSHPDDPSLWSWASVPAVRAQGLVILLGGRNAQNNDTMIVGSKTYTFKTSINNANQNEVQIETDGKQTMRNFANAIGAVIGSGTQYSSATTPNADVTALNVSTDTYSNVSISDQKVLISAAVPGSAGNSITLRGGSGADIYFLVRGGSNMSGGTLGGGLDQNSYTGDLHFGFANDNSLVYGGNSADGFFSWNGNSAVAPQAYVWNPNGNIFQYFQQRLCVAGVPSSPTTLFYSKSTFPTDFDFSISPRLPGDGGTVDLGDAGDAITALRIGPANSNQLSNKSLYVFKKSRRVYEVYFDADGTAHHTEVAVDTGAVNHQSTVVVDNDIWYVDPGNNIASLGKRADVLNEIRTDPQSVAINNTTPFLDFSAACGIFHKKRRFAIFSMASFGSSVNDTQLVYFQDYQSWWLWKGLNANEYAVYKGSLVWCSSVNLNVYLYDEKSFSDNGNPIISYRSTGDTEGYEIVGRIRVPRHDQFKQTRFAIIRGYIADQTKMTLDWIPNDDESPSGPMKSVTFVGNDPNVTEGEASVTFGNVTFGLQPPFGGGSANNPALFPLRQFLVVMSIDEYTWMKMRLRTRVDGKDMPYIVTYMTTWSGLLEMEKFTDVQKI